MAEIRSTWRDNFISVDSSKVESVDFVTIRVFKDSEREDNLIFEGRSYKDGEGKVRFNVSPLVADVLRREGGVFKETGNVIAQASEVIGLEAEIIVVAMNGEFEVGRWKFVYRYNWSYILNDIDERIVKSESVTGEISSDMPLAFTMSKPNTKVGVAFIDNDGNTVFSKVYESGERAVDVCVDPFERKKEVEVDEENKIAEFDVVEGCRGRYALYYVNSKGCVDFLLMEGESERVEEYERGYIEKSYDNGKRNARGKSEFVKTQKTKWRLKSRYFGEREYERCGELFGSNNVMLLDLSDNVFEEGMVLNKFIAVNVVNSTFEQKSRRANGGKFFQLEIEVEDSQTRLRK